MHHLPYLAAIFVLSFIFALLITPNDPMSMLTALTALLIVAALAYWLGVRSASRTIRIQRDRAGGE
ncbi:MAG: hypothetical protein WD069_02585 [Planctomycetales bacterium]